jgi:hypothetical protein
MTLVKALVAKGVTQAGAVEVVLGLALSQQSDRMVLSKLGLAAASDSLRKGPRPPRQTPSEQRVSQLVLGLNPSASTSAMEYSIGLQAPLQQKQLTEQQKAQLKTLKDRKERLIQSSLNIEREIQRLTVQLTQLLASPPKEWPLPPELKALMGLFGVPTYSGLPPQVWVAQVTVFRNMIQNQQGLLAELQRQLAQVSIEIERLLGSTERFA